MPPTSQIELVDVYFPMAGQGARFGHKFKPFLTIGGETFIAAAVAPFRRFAERIGRFVFVYLAQQERDFAVRARLAELFAGVSFTTVLLETPTRGPAETIGRAVQQLAASGPALVCDCDHALDVGPLFAVREPYAALLPVWPLAGESLAAWSVARVADGRVLAIAEKRMPAGDGGTPMGVIGCYGFADIGDVAARAERLAATNFSDVIAQLLAEGATVRAARIESATFFGDPERLARAQTGAAG